MRKTVGILSMQRVINYGSFLQAYALKQLLLQNGANEVYFIDINPGKPLPGFEMKNGILNRLKRILYLLISRKLFVKIKDITFYYKIRKNIKRNYPMLELDKKQPKEFDMVVIGSDEVFNCCQKTAWGYTLQLYGDINGARNVISYAGSFGRTTYEQLLKYGIEGKIGEVMNTLSKISVRDFNSYDIVEKITGLKPEIHLDPVLVYGYQNEIENKSIHYQEHYMIVYSYQGRINDTKEIGEIVSFAKLKGLKLISIYCRYDWCDEAIIPDTPFDVLAWYKGAEYVVTDTFHGTIFSIITRRRFCTLLRDTNGEKIGALLRQLSLEDRVVVEENILQLFTILAKDINYEVIDSFLLGEKKRAIQYIGENLKVINHVL